MYLHLFEQEDNLNYFRKHQDFDSCASYVGYIGDLKESQVPDNKVVFNKEKEKIKQVLKTIKNKMSKLILEQDLDDTSNILVNKIFKLIEINE